MKLFTGWLIPAGMVLMAATANAQGSASHGTGDSPYKAVSDFNGPYAAMPPEAPAPGHGPSLLPPHEVYTVVRESGFSPLGIPHQRGMFYVISVIDRRGDDGRLVIDARTGELVRFVPAYRMGDNSNEDAAPPTYAPAGPLPLASNPRGGPPRPPASIPMVASRTPPAVPMPKASPQRAPTAVAEPAQQSAAVQMKPADMPATPPAAPPVVEARPAPPQIQPTQPMPEVQGLE
ncbi:hypothetical protein GALL_536550 [mine drainage metagenome]|uniref:Uncharacterized protein n=1 Tax=mine drainage metagenome TaxID=410659 RepID=A0A1J5P2B8_9ZZZZ